VRTVFNRRLAALLAGAATGLAACAPAAHAGEAQTLQARYAALEPALAHSPFGRPLLLESRSSDGGATRGDVDAVVEQPFERVAAALRQAQSWCRIFILQTNVKRCAAQGRAPDEQLQVGVARRHTDAVDEAHAVDFRYEAALPEPDYLSVSLAADEGPVGTRDYRLRLAATPLDARRTFVHLAYAYEMGLAARLATRAYLATAGRNKVGFSVVGRDAQGRPVLAGGVRGIAERNTLRYFLAIESFLATLDAAPAQRLEQRLRRFHAALERYPAQLHELALDDYLAQKRREAPAE
jgi:hypothetical protein